MVTVKTLLTVADEEGRTYTSPRNFLEKTGKPRFYTFHYVDGEHIGKNISDLSVASGKKAHDRALPEIEEIDISGGNLNTSESTDEMDGRVVDEIRELHAGKRTAEVSATIESA